MSIPNIGELLFLLPTEKRKIVRLFEKCTFKLIKLKCSLIFNHTCLQENILPIYSNIKLHDKAARREKFTLDFRRNLIQREIDNAETKRRSLEKEAAQLNSTLVNEISPNILPKIIDAITNNGTNLNINCRHKMVRKLNKLYKGEVMLPEENKHYINLSSYELSETEQSFLNLGVNVHVQTQVDKYKKKVEFEILYEDITRLENDNILTVNPNLREQLRAEGTKEQKRRPQSS